MGELARLHAGGHESPHLRETCAGKRGVAAGGHWLSARNAWVPLPGNRHQEILGRLLIRLGGGAKLIPDAHLAALAIEHGLDLCSTDGDFARFDGLRWMNPLTPPPSSALDDGGRLVALSPGQSLFLAQAGPPQDGTEHSGRGGGQQAEFPLQVLA